MVADEFGDRKKGMDPTEAAFTLLVTLTSFQVTAGLVTLYLWGLGIMHVPPRLGMALMFGPCITGAAALWVWETR